MARFLVDKPEGSFSEHVKLADLPFKQAIAHVAWLKGKGPQEYPNTIIAYQVPANSWNATHEIALDAAHVPLLSAATSNFFRGVVDMEVLYPEWPGGDYLVVAPPGHDLDWSGELREVRPVAIYYTDSNTLITYDIIHEHGAEKRIRALIELLRKVGVPIPKRPLDVPPRPRKQYAVTIGTDPEFEIVERGAVVSAANVLDPFETRYGEVGIDGAGGPMEIRPEPGTPEEVVENVAMLLRAAAEKGYTFTTASVRFPVGAHIHIGGITDLDIGEFARALDHALGPFVTEMNGPARRNSSYGRLGDWRSQSWGVEWRVPPSAVFSHPEVALEILRAVYHIAHKLANEGEWDDGADTEWPRIREKVAMALKFVQEHELRMHINTWLHIAGSTERVKPERPFREVVMLHDGTYDDLFFPHMIGAMEAANIVGTLRVYPLHSSRGEVSNLPGFLGEYRGAPEDTIALPYIFRNDPAYRQKHMQEFIKALAEWYRANGKSNDRYFVYEVIPLTGELVKSEPAFQVRRVETWKEDDDDYEYCHRCDARIHADDAFWDGDRPYCEDCYNELFEACDECGSYIRSENAFYVDDYAFCEACYDELYTGCDNCGEEVRRDDSVRVDDLTLCERCYDRLYTRCEACGEDVRRGVACEYCAEGEPLPPVHIGEFEVAEGWEPRA